MRLLLLSGSFHSRSYTQALLDAVTQCLAGHELRRYPLPSLPFYTPEPDADEQARVSSFLDCVRWSEGVVICTPEYNHSIPAVLKNALDWASRPAFQSPLRDKPVTLITQAESPVGGARAQAHLKLVLDSTLSRIHPAHEMMVTDVRARFDDQLQLVDDKTRQRLARHLADFLDFASRG